MNALAMVQALFKKAWVPAKDLRVGLHSNLVPQKNKIETRPTHEEQINETLSERIENVSNLEPKSRIAPISTLPQISKKLVKEAIQPVQIVAALEEFHVAATMIDKGLGIVIALPHQYAALSGADYMMLSKLIAAIQQKKGFEPRPIEFDFFHWPPKQGLASTLKDAEISLQALKGFLHKMANRQQSSWIILDENFARFCFQKPDMSEFDCLERHQNKLIAAPSISRLHSSPDLKKQLWLKLSQEVI